MTAFYHGPVIDPHHHLWDLSLSRHPWLQPKPTTHGDMVYGSIQAIRRDFGVDDYLAAAQRQNIVATVHVEAGWSEAHIEEETPWLDGLDKAGGVARCYVARVLLDAPDVVDRLDAEAANPRVVGIRDIVSWHPEPSKSFARAAGLMSNAGWRAGLRAASARGLVFELMLYPWQIEEALRLVADFPETLFVVNHCGSPADRSADGMADWRAGLRMLSRAQNVLLKVSDLVAYDPDWTFESLRAVMAHCIDCFGTKRAMFASDFPVAGLHASFDEVYGAFRTFAAPLSTDEQCDLFFSTANQTYRLGLDADGKEQTDA